MQCLPRMFGRSRVRAVYFFLWFAGIYIFV